MKEKLSEAHAIMEKNLRSRIENINNPKIEKPSSLFKYEYLYHINNKSKKKK